MAKIGVLARFDVLRAAFVVLVCVGLHGVTTHGQTAIPAVAPRERIVLVISLDGFPVEALSDARLPVPTLRKLIAQGAAVARMTVSNPSVTWPNHTTLVTGVRPIRHGVLYNGRLVREGEGLPLRVDRLDRKDLVKTPTVYDLAFNAGLTTAQVNWAAIGDAQTITYALPENPSATGRIECELMAAGRLTSEDIDDFQKTSMIWRDQLWTDAAVHIIKRHTPNLLLVKLRAADSVQHAHGPATLASQAAMSHLDSQIEKMLSALSEVGMREKATVLIVSDHGFKTVRHTIRANAALREAGLLRIVANKKVEGDAYVIPEGGTAIAYVTSPTRREAVLEQLKQLFAKTEGVKRIVEPEAFAALGLPRPEQDANMGELLLIAEDGYAFGGGEEGAAVRRASAPYGSHGYVSTDGDMDALFLAAGYGVRAGAQVGRIENIAVAPTIAALLGLEMQDVDGRPVPDVSPESQPRAKVRP